MLTRLTPLPLIALLAATPLQAQEAEAPADEPVPEAPAGEAAPEAAPTAEDPAGAAGTAAEAAPVEDGATEDGATEAGAAPDGAADAPAGLDMGEPADGDAATEAEPQPGEPYVREAFGDWSLRCIQPEDGAEICQLYQLLQDEGGNQVAEISLFPLPEGGQAAAGATIVTPLETLLTEELTLAVDGANARRYPFTFCNRAGCVARVGFTAEEVQQFRNGNEAQLSIVPAAAPDQTVALSISLTGFTAGFENATVPPNVQ